MRLQLTRSGHRRRKPARNKKRRTLPGVTASIRNSPAEGPADVHQSTLTPPVSSTRPQFRSERIRLTRAATGLKPAEKLLLRSLVDFMGNSSECWPSLSRLAEEVGCSIRHVRRMLRSLEAAGWIATRSRFRPDRSQTSCVFQWVKAPDLHVRPPRTSVSPLEKDI